MIEESIQNKLDYPSTDASATQAVRKGDARDLPVADDSVDLIFTSPPYWKKRDYEHENQIGQEKNPEEYINNLIDSFEEW